MPVRTIISLNNINQLLIKIVNLDNINKNNQ